ncbi:RNA-binding protein [Thermotoga sp. Ku-13t]|uniref:RNA-binding S4 domain-containing protein n=1 Tax=Thermotoga sp. Ku-13t TaxID=1755813 RepID=UPI0013EA6F6D|nr:RNA-binding S4 domain-containing protein [Thermotoga sp. Ku-13t]KAF2957488.1 RNA-binding protein [Thermotoga sp. Ku-13t]
MRIDKYLKQSGIIKRRTIAQRMIESGKVFVNGRIVKPSYEVKIGDKIKIIFPFKEVELLIDQQGKPELLNETKKDHIDCADPSDN